MDEEYYVHNIIQKGGIKKCGITTDVQNVQITAVFVL